MCQTLITRVVEIQLGAEGMGFALILGAGIDEGSLVAREGRAVRMPLDEVLLDLGTDGLEEVAHVADDGEVAQQSVIPLYNVVHTQNNQWPDNDKAPQHRRVVEAQAEQQRRRGDGEYEEQTT
ncbi:MAG: hypothetical protein O2782_00665, partial [bacterium]|nr:hypothetical protein [bacterium]